MYEYNFEDIFLPSLQLIMNSSMNEPFPLALKNKGLVLEVLTTENAIAAYNYLVEEGRVVAAALIPPFSVR